MEIVCSLIMQHLNTIKIHDSGDDGVDDDAITMVMTMVGIMLMTMVIADRTVVTMTML